MAEFKLSKELLKKYIEENKLETVIPEDIKTRYLRNLVMPFVPEVDNKTYTFMFRSDLCKHIANVSLIVGLLGLLNEIVSYFFGNIEMFRNERKDVVLYAILIISYYLFWSTRNYFYSIAIKIPFSAFIAIKNQKLKKQSGSE